MLFDTDLTFLSVVNVNEEDNISSNKLLSSTEGFIKGNMFEGLYKPYKGMIPKMPKTSCEKTAHLYKIMELEFAINDINLYLDVNPDDEKMFSCLKEYIKHLCKYEGEYVKKYGPISLNENLGDKNKWPMDFPWEKEDSLYV